MRVCFFSLRSPSFTLTLRPNPIIAPLSSSPSRIFLPSLRHLLPDKGSFRQISPPIPPKTTTSEPLLRPSSTPSAPLRPLQPSWGRGVAGLL